MKSKKLIIEINQPVEKVFEFTIDPRNTPKWVDSIKYEEVDRWPVQVGTHYRNHGNNKVWSIYTVKSFEENKKFVFQKNDNNYSVRYVFTPLAKDKTRLEYFEWVEKGNLEEPFTMEILEKLKSILEN